MPTEEDDIPLGEAGQRAYERTKAELKEARLALAKFKDVDPEQYQQLLTDKQAKEEELALKRGEFEKLTKKEQERATAAEQRANQAESTLGQTKVETAIEKAFFSSDGAKDSADLILAYAAKHVRWNGADKVVEVINLATGDPRLGKDGKAVTVKQLMEELAVTPGSSRLFEPSERSRINGSGTLVGKQTKSTKETKEVDKMSASERLTYLRAQKTG
jgi:hypothetical protein